MQTLRKIIFGKGCGTRERQLALELHDLRAQAKACATNDDAPAPKSPYRPRMRAHRNIGALPKHQPRREQLPEATACPCCQGQIHKIGEDVTTCWT